MPRTGRIASLYDNKDARSRNAARERLEQIRGRHQQEATAHRKRAAQELSALDAKHAQANESFGSYRPPDRVQRAQKEERQEVRKRQREAEERIADRHDRELKQARK